MYELRVTRRPNDYQVQIEDKLVTTVANRSEIVPTARRVLAEHGLPQQGMVIVWQN